MSPQIKTLVIFISIMAFLPSCAPVNKIVNDVKDLIKVDKKDTPKAPAEDKETIPQKEPVVNEPEPAAKETKTPPPASGKKGTRKTSPPPTDKVFGPR
jgi:hypothetical protein